MKRILTPLLILLGLFLLNNPLRAQTKRIMIKGTVVDANTREALIGATVSLDGKPLRGLGSTDVNGSFSYLVDDGVTLVFTYLLYERKTITLKPGQTTLTVAMNPTKNDLQEVVIRGYQQRSREVTTGASYIVSGKEIQDAPTSNVEQLLQGKVAGLGIQQSTGAPGMRGSVAIRGLTSINVTGSGNEAFLQPTSPLYVIDGVPMDADKATEMGFQQAGPGISPLSLIPQEDIASIEVLKDATATSLYGSRGAYGVILIQTVRGKSEVPRVRYTSQFFMKGVPKLRETLGGSYERRIKMAQILSYAQFATDIYRISNTPSLADSLNGYYNNATDWQGVFYQNTYNQNHNLALDGGNTRFNYKANIGFYSEDGVIRNTGFERYNLNMNMEFKPNTRLRFFGSVMGMVGKSRTGDGVGLLQQGVASNGLNSSLLPGPSYFQSTGGVLSSLKTVTDAGPKNFRGIIEANYELFKGFNLTTNGSYDYTLETKDIFTPAAANSQFAKIEAYNGYKSTIYNRNNISYTRSFGTDHNFFVNTFTEIYIRSGQSSSTIIQRSPNDQFQGPLGYDGYNSRGGGVLPGFQDERQLSLAVAFTYDYKKKYILDLTYRTDGSSVSGSKDPYSKNPSIGLKWNFNKEKWMEKLDWLNYGDIRLTAGKNIYPNGRLTDIYGQYVPNGFYNNVPRVGIDYGQIPNPFLKPTSVVQYNFGVDLGLYNGKLDVIFDTYYKGVSNLTFATSLSNTLAFANYTSNDAALSNYGYELVLSTRPLSRKSKVSWSFSVNGAINREVLTKLPAEFNNQQIDVNAGIVKKVGRNSLSNFLFINQGVYGKTTDVPVDPVTGLRYRNGSAGSYLNSFQAGDMRIVDTNGDYILDERDMQVTGNTQPLITGGMSNTLGYKDFSLFIAASYTAKRSVLNNALAERLKLMSNPFGLNTAVPLDELNMWRPGQDNSNARYANAYNYAHNTYTDPFRLNQSVWQEDGGWLKINQITLSYIMRQDFIRSIGLKSLRFNMSMQNIATFSRYSGPNPEGVTALGRDGSNGYPVPRTYSLGINVEL